MLSRASESDGTVRAKFEANRGECSAVVLMENDCSLAEGIELLGKPESELISAIPSATVDKNGLYMALLPISHCLKPFNHPTSNRSSSFFAHSTKAAQRAISWRRS